MEERAVEASGGGGGSESAEEEHSQHRFGAITEPLSSARRRSLSQLACAKPTWSCRGAVAVDSDCPARLAAVGGRAGRERNRGTSRVRSRRRLEWVLGGSAGPDLGIFTHREPTTQLRCCDHRHGALVSSSQLPVMTHRCLRRRALRGGRRVSGSPATAIRANDKWEGVGAQSNAP
jgi:hypothetical protein